MDGMTNRPTTLQIEEISTPEAFQALEPYWNVLLDRCDRQEIYLTFEWISSWWLCFGSEDKSLLVLVVRDGTEIVAIAPCMEHRESLFGLPVRSIKLLSMADYPDSPSNCAASRPSGPSARSAPPPTTALRWSRPRPTSSR